MTQLSPPTVQRFEKQSIRNKPSPSEDSKCQPRDDEKLRQVIHSADETLNNAFAAEILDISTSRYSGGLVSYLDVVTAQQNLLTDQQELAVIQGQRLVSSVLLVKALGGGWDASSLAAVRVRPKLKDIVAP